MKKYYFLFLACLSIFISCSSGDEETILPNEKEPVALEGKQMFIVEMTEITAKTDSGLTQKNLEPAFVILSIANENGAAVFTREKIALVKEGENYITNEITLNSGNYTLTEFIVTDADDIVISMTPKNSSVLAQFANNTLPLEFSVSDSQTNTTSTENINAAGYATVDFGYSDISLNIPQSTDFFTLTVDDSESLTSKTLNLKSITGSTYVIDWGDGNIEEYVSTIADSGIDNTINHAYSENGIYTITISGAIESIVLLEFNSNDAENSWQSHLANIQLEGLTLLKSCKLNAGNLISLDTSNNLALETLNLGANQIITLDLSNNPQLKTVSLNFNKLTNLDISQNTNLEILSLNNNEISNIDLSNNPKLKVMLARDNFLNTVDYSNNIVLEHFDVANNNISSINLSTNLDLVEINLGLNQISNIDISNNVNLIRVDLYENPLNSIDVTSNLKLVEPYLQNMNLSTIDLSANVELERLYIDNNNFQMLDLSANTKISHLNIGGNQFEGATLDQILTGVYDNVIINDIRDGYINYLNNIGTSNIDQTTVSKMNELIVDYNWFFNNG